MDIAIPFLLGLIFGLLVGSLSYWLLISLINKIDKYELNVGKRKFFFRYALRYIIYLLALFLVYKNTCALLGTGLGIVIISKVIVVKFTLKQKGGE